jgi:beta-phosphoglucomutase-like phosphatase (HAD superfamily)
MPSSSSSSSSSSKASEEAKRLKEEKHKRDATSSKKEQARAKYQEAARGTTTVDELVGVADLEKNFFKEGEWQPAWAHVEFVSRPRSAERIPSARLMSRTAMRA